MSITTVEAVGDPAGAVGDRAGVEAVADPEVRPDTRLAVTDRRVDRHQVGRVRGHGFMMPPSGSRVRRRAAASQHLSQQIRPDSSPFTSRDVAGSDLCHPDQPERDR